MTNQGVGDWVHRRRVKSAGLAALIHRGHVISYDELAERIDRLAGAFAARGIRKGDRVAYLGNNHPAFVESLFRQPRDRRDLRSPQYPARRFRDRLRAERQRCHPAHLRPQP